MNKRFLLFATALLAVGGLVTLGVYFYIFFEGNTRVTEQDYIKARKALQGEARPEEPSAPARIDPARSVRLAVGGLGLADEEQNRRVGDLITAELTGAHGLNLVERQSLDKVLHDYRARQAWLHAAYDLFGGCSNEIIQVGNAWRAVGVESQSAQYNNTVACGNWPALGTTAQAIHQLSVASSCAVNITASATTVYFSAKDRVVMYPGFRAISGSNLIIYNCFSE